MSDNEERDKFREVSPLKKSDAYSKAEEEEGLDSIGEFSERTLTRLATSSDRLAEALRRDSFSSISSLGTRQQFTTALDNLRVGLLGQADIQSPVRSTHLKVLNMDSPSDLSPNAPPVGFDDPTYLTKTQGQSIPPGNNGPGSTEGSVDSSGFEKVEHDVLEEYGQQFANQMQQSIFGQLPNDPDNVVHSYSGFEIIEKRSLEMESSTPVVYSLKRIPGDIDKPYPPGLYDDEGMSSSRDDVIEKDYSGLIDIPHNSSPPPAAPESINTVEQGDLLGDFDTQQAVPQFTDEPVKPSSPPLVPETTQRYRLDDEDEPMDFTKEAHNLVEDAVRQAQETPEDLPAAAAPVDVPVAASDEKLSHQELSHEPLVPEPAVVDPREAVYHVPTEEEPMQAAEYDEPAYEEAIRHDEAEPSPKHAAPVDVLGEEHREAEGDRDAREEEREAEKEARDFHNEVEDMLSNVHEKDTFQEMSTPQQTQTSQPEETEPEPDFRSQTPDETPYERHGPLTIPELPEKLPTEDELLQFEKEQNIPSPGFHGHHGFETVPRPPTPPKSLTDEDIQPASVDLGHGTSPHHAHHDRHHSILKHSPSNAGSPGDPWFTFKEVDPRILELIYWRDPKKSAIALSLTLIALFVLAKYPLLSVIAYTGLAVLAGTLGFRVFKAVESQIKKTGGENPFQEYLAQDLSLPQERVHSQVDVLVEHGTLLANQVKKLIFVESIVDSVKFGLLLWSLTYIASWFSGFALIILAVLAVFTLPKVYETYQEPIDAQLEVVSGHIKNVTQLLEEKLPFLKRAQPVEEEKKDQ